MIEKRGGSGLGKRHKTEKGSANLEREPIAIVGIGCRFPGGADNPGAFWELLRSGVDAIGEIPADRFDIDAFYDPKPATPGKVASRFGGFLTNLDQFDPFFFGISPREADRLDPQQRLLLEISWEALEDAGVVPKTLEGSPTGVFVGMWINDFERRLFADPDQMDFYMTTGSGRYTAAGRLSRFFGLQGPSLTVDTACSSSLVAVHLACQSLWSGECDTALAGGANVILTPFISIAYSQSDMLAPDGRCKFGDARADGYVRSEGAGVVVLKPLSRALEENNPIYATIIGAAVNNDGRTSGSMGTPGILGQIDLLRKAYRSAGISPGRVHYVEAHGTGTRAGDPVELQAMAEVLTEGRPQDRPCVVGSVKTNIGHVEGAAGLAGLIKAALCLKHRGIPATLHFQAPNPNLNWDSLPFVISPVYRPWPVVNETAFAGVNSFGISGTNAHVVLQEAPGRGAHALEQDLLARQEVKIGKQLDRALNESIQTPYLLPLSAHTPEALTARVEAIKEVLFAGQDQVRLGDLCYTASLRRTHHEYRLGVAGRTAGELAEKLQAFLQNEARFGLSSGRTDPDLALKVVFVFPGQGSQWLGMGRMLLQYEPVFRQVLEDCEEAMTELVDWSLMEQLILDQDSPRYRMHDIAVIQPVLLSIEIAFAALWKSWGIEPNAVIGHSMGEAAAALVAGVISLQEAMRIICCRSRLMRRTSGKGAMAVVELSMDEAQDAIRGYEDRLSIAVNNSPRSHVLAGDPAALDEVLKGLQERDVFCRLVDVDVASHSPHMDPLKGELVALLSGVHPRVASIPIYSTALGKVLYGPECVPEYWGLNLRQPVRFSEMVQRLLKEKHDLFIEMSPHPILLPAIRQCMEHFACKGMTIPSGVREEDEQITMLGSAAELHALGYPLDWMKFYPEGGTCVSLPTYPWQREHFWYGDENDSEVRLSRRAVSNKAGKRLHPFLDSCWSSSVHPSLHFWETDLSLEDHPFLGDHCVRGAVIFPAAALIETVLAAARETFRIEVPSLERVVFEHALDLPREGMKRIQIIFDAEIPEIASFRFLSLEDNESDMRAAWRIHAKGFVRLKEIDSATRGNPDPDICELAQNKESSTCGEVHYQAMTRRGLMYGPAFQRVEETWQKDGTIFARLSSAQFQEADSSRYRIHPTLLDACFQLLVAAYPDTGRGATNDDTLLPVGLGTIRIFDRVVDEREWYACATPVKTDASGDGTFVGDVFLISGEGNVVVEAHSLRFKRIEGNVQPQLQDWLYQVEWQLRNLEQRGTVPEDCRGRWLLFVDKRNLGNKLASMLEARGGSCAIVKSGEKYRLLGPRQFQVSPDVPRDYLRLLDELNAADRSPWRGVIHMWSLDLPASSEISLSSLDKAEKMSCISTLHLCQALAHSDGKGMPRLWLITQGAQKVEREDRGLSVSQSSLWGLGRVIGNEHPEYRCSLVDLSIDPSVETVKHLADEIASEGNEDQVAFRGDRRFVARLVRCHQEQPAEDNKRGAPERFLMAGQEGYRLEIDAPGILDHLTLRPSSRKSPGPEEVEIRVYAAGLNFLDVMKAMGIYPGLEPGLDFRMGAECSGIVVAVGDGVHELQVGDEVICLTPSFEEVSCFSSYVTVRATYVVRKPSQLSFEDAATVPVAFLTAYYALHYLGRMAAGESVLIHSAAGGVGLAAVQLAQQAGVEIFATAGSPEKREFLKGLGIAHVMDSRSLAFSEEVIGATMGNGVDLVLNSLVGEAMIKSLALLKPYGRFLEIGKSDIYQDSRIGLKAFRENLSYFAIDLAKLVMGRQELASSLFHDIIRSFAENTLHPISLKAFPASESAAAFRWMAQASHIGKIVIQFNESQVMVQPATKPTVSIQADAAYLITGGLGGLGLEVARWLVECGARHLALMGRSVPAPTAEKVLEELRKLGAEVVVAQGDVAQESDVARIVELIHSRMPELRGVIHAAGVLDDATVLALDAARFRSVFGPKAKGAWNLHSLTRKDRLDFFVLFSSVASLLGLPGQGNYAAANAFLDGLAHYRKTLGMPALCINWGPWSDVGLAAQKTIRGDRLASKGLESLAPRHGIAALEKLISEDVTQVAVMPFDWDQWQRSYPGTTIQPYYAGVSGNSAHSLIAIGDEKGKAASFRDLIMAEDSGKRRRYMLENHLQHQVGQVLKLPPARVCLNRPLKTLGLDSLMSLELRNRLEASLGLKLSATLVWNYPTIEVLATHLAGKLGLPLADAIAIVPSDSAAEDAIVNGEKEIDQVLSEIEQLSDEEARRLLENED